MLEKATVGYDFAEEARRLGVPLIPPLPHTPETPNGTIAICGECGLHLTQVMGYCCPRTRCPTGLGGRH